jgi:hypothetical protein
MTFFRNVEDDDNSLFYTVVRERRAISLAVFERNAGPLTTGACLWEHIPANDGYGSLCHIIGCSAHCNGSSARGREIYAELQAETGTFRVPDDVVFTALENEWKRVFSECA